MSEIIEHISTHQSRSEITNKIMKIYQKRDPTHPFRIGMSGGSVLWVLDALRENISDMSDIKIYQIDERYVPHDHPDSNAHAILEKILGSKASFIPFPILDTPQSSAEKYAEILENVTLDITILGCGPDGHTASIFPHDPLMDTERLTYATTTEAFAIRDRMTMSFTFIERSAHSFLILEGDKKRDIFTRITDIEADYIVYPARRVLDMKQAEIYFSLEYKKLIGQYGERE